MAIHDLEPEVNVSVFKHLHSTNTGITDLHAVPSLQAPVGYVCPRRQKATHSRAICRTRAIRCYFQPARRYRPSCKIGTSRAGAGGPISLFYVFTVNGTGRMAGTRSDLSGTIPQGTSWTAAHFPTTILRSACLSSPVRVANGCFPPAVTVNGKTVGANLASIMERLGPVNVELGSVVSLGFNQNGERDIVTYLEHVRPRYFIP